MDDVNILGGGVEVLYEIKERLLELDDLKNRSAKLDEDIKSLTKTIEVKSKAEENEIASTISKRRTESTLTLNASLDKAQQRLKKAKSDREQSKNQKVTERIKNDTAGLHEDKRAVKEEINAIFSKHGILRLINNKPFFTLFFPNGILDFAIIAGVIAAIFTLPALLFLLFTNPETRKVWILVLIYIGLFALVVGISYITIRKTRSQEYYEALRDAKAHYQKIDDINRRIKKAEKAIRKDSDESQYDLSEHDEKIKGIEEEVDNILEDRKKTLADFEGRIKQNITDEIHTRYAEELDQARASLAEKTTEQTEVDADLNRLSVDIAKKYEVYLGKEHLTVPMMDELIAIINDSEASTVGEAIEYCNKRSAIT